jgi:glyoxylase I family protein
MANSSEELGADLFHLEQQLLQPSTRRDEVALRSLLAEDFREFGSSGRIYTRQQVINALAVESPHTVILSDPLCCQVAADIALLTYRSTGTNAHNVASHALRTSLWVYRDGRWQMIFHQGTPI